MDRMTGVGPFGVCVKMEIGPIRIPELLNPPPPSYLRHHVERRVANAIDRSFVDVVLSACDGTTDVGDLSEIISIECHRMAECSGSTICSSPAIWLDRAVFMSNWDLVITGHVPHGHAIRVDRGRCSVIPCGWPRVDRLASHLMDGGTVGVTICVAEASAVARYRFVGDRDVRGVYDADQG